MGAYIGEYYGFYERGHYVGVETNGSSEDAFAAKVGFAVGVCAIAGGQFVPRWQGHGIYGLIGSVQGVRYVVMKQDALHSNLLKGAI